MKIELQTLELLTLDKNNIEHVKFLKSLIKDETITKRFQGISASILHDYNNSFFGRGYFVSNKNELIGYINIGNYNKEEKCVYLKSAITSSKRGQGYGKRLLTEISDYIFLNYIEIESIKLKIAEDNKQSLKTAAASGYSWLEKDYYIKENPYLEIKKSKK